LFTVLADRPEELPWLVTSALLVRSWIRALSAPMRPWLAYCCAALLPPVGAVPVVAVLVVDGVVVAVVLGALVVVLTVLGALVALDGAVVVGAVAVVDAELEPVVAVGPLAGLVVTGAPPSSSWSWWWPP
jgi:hypothetical protein